MAPAWAEFSDFRLRALTALVLAPAVLAVVYVGGPWFVALICACGVAMAWEWAQVTGPDHAAGVVLVVAASTVAAAVLAVLQAPEAAAVLCLAGALVGYGVARWRRGESRAPWAALGVLWIGLPCAAAVLLREAVGGGLQTFVLLLAVVWATDIGAYLCGRVVGGPKLAPRVSPGKTWSGAAGGLLAAVLVGAAATLAAQPPLTVVVVAAVLSVLAQLGDLAESAWKRHFQVKDSGTLIPGHGGVLDRVDGLLPAVFGLAVLDYAQGGSVIQWP